MTREVTIKLYQYDELSEAAKEKAMEWYTSNDYFYSDWYEFVYDYIRDMADCLGLDIKCQMKNNGWTPIIYFDLDHRRIEYQATYIYDKDWVQDVEKDFGKQAFTAGSNVSIFLNDWKQKVLNLQKSAFYGLKLDVDCHRWVSVEVTNLYDRVVTQEQVKQAEELIELFNDFALDMLQMEWDYIHSEEYIVENICVNGYEFTEDGDIA